MRTKKGRVRWEIWALKGQARLGSNSLAHLRYRPGLDEVIESSRIGLGSPRISNTYTSVTYLPRKQLERTQKVIESLAQPDQVDKMDGLEPGT